jgi:hypothetical protein
MDASIGPELAMSVDLITCSLLGLSGKPRASVLRWSDHALSMACIACCTGGAGDAGSASRLDK